MTYLVFCAGASAPVVCESMGAAIKTACSLMEKGTVVWQIKGSDGFKMERSDVELECSRRAEAPGA
jgi:hypothetical protein